MSNKPIDMNKLRQIIRLYGQGKGTKTINTMLGVSRNTVKKHLQIFYSSGISYDTFFAMSESELSFMFHVSKMPIPSQRQLELEAILPELCKQLKRKRVTREQIHRQYLEKYPEGYGRS